MLAVVGSSKNAAARLPRTPQNKAPVDVNWANANSRSQSFIDQAVPKIALLGVVEFSKLGRRCLKQFQSRHFYVANTKPAKARMLRMNAGNCALAIMFS